jgi:hypothetical protein
MTFLRAGKKVSCPGSTLISFSGRTISFEGRSFFVFLAFAMCCKVNEKTALRIERFL